MIWTFAAFVFLVTASIDAWMFMNEIAAGLFGPLAIGNALLAMYFLCHSDR